MNQLPFWLLPILSAVNIAIAYANFKAYDVTHNVDNWWAGSLCAAIGAGTIVGSFMRILTQ